MRIVHKNITEQIVNYFAENIESGNWKVGEKIPSENQLTSMLGVSRASVRQAVSQLSGLGILETVHGKGTFLIDDQVREAMSNDSKITAEDCKDVEKVLEFRRIVESEACYIAAQKNDASLIHKLENYVVIMKRNKDDVEKFVTADIKFHQTICRATENTLLEKSLNKVFEENHRSQQLTRKIFGYQNGIYYHERIIEAMRINDAKAAQTAMYEHLQNAIERLKKYRDLESSEKSMP